MITKLGSVSGLENRLQISMRGLFQCLNQAFITALGFYLLATLVSHFFITFVVMVAYDSASIYIQSSTTLCEKIEKIDAIISALEDTALQSAANDNIDEYWLDDGQSKIKTSYKGTDQIFKSIIAFERMRQIYVNRLNGFVVRMVDSRSLRR